MVNTFAFLRFEMGQPSLVTTSCSQCSPPALGSHISSYRFSVANLYLHSGVLAIYIKISICCQARATMRLNGFGWKLFTFSFLGKRRFILSAYIFLLCLIRAWVGTLGLSFRIKRRVERIREPQFLIKRLEVLLVTTFVYLIHSEFN